MSKKSVVWNALDHVVDKTMSSVDPERIIKDVVYNVKRSIYDSVIAVVHGVLFPGEPNSFNSSIPTAPGGERYSYQQPGQTNYNTIATPRAVVTGVQTYRNPNGCEVHIPSDYNQRGTYVDFIGPMAIRESERVMAELKSRIAYMQVVTVGDLHGIAGVPTVPGDFDFGWRDMSFLGRVIIRDGYRVTLQNPVPIR